MIRGRSTISLATIVVALLLTMAGGCGTSSDTAHDSASDKALAKALEQHSGAKVSIDPAKNGATGGIDVTDGSGSYSVGSNAKVPKGFPSTVKLPKFQQILTAVSTGAGKYRRYSVSGLVAGEGVDVAFDGLASAMKDTGFTIDGNARKDLTGSSVRLFTATKGTLQVRYDLLTAKDQSDAMETVTVGPTR